MWMWRLIKFILCAVPAAVLAIAGPWWLHDWMMGQGVPDIAASQLSIVLGATILMIGIATAWHLAGWPLVSQRDEVPRILRERKFPAAVIILSLVVAAWAVGAGVIDVQTVEALAGWGIAGQMVAGALGLFVISVVVLMWKLTNDQPIGRDEIADSAPTILKVAAGLLLTVAGYAQRLGEQIAERLGDRRRG